MRTLVLFATCMTTLCLHGSYYGYDSRGGLYWYCQQLEANMENPKEASRMVNLIAQIECCNLAAEGEKEALEWTRKYLERYPLDQGGGYWVLLYLATKGDARDIETVSKYAEDALAQLFKTRVAGINAFDFDYVFPASIGYPTFLPSVANTGPQAVYVREILNRYWEENGRDSSKIPQELLTMVVSFDDDGNPVCNIDLSKYGLSVPVITPKPHKDKFHWWTEQEGDSWKKMAVVFPDLAEPVEITPYMNRKAPDWKGLYVKKPVAEPPPTPAPPSPQGETNEATATPPESSDGIPAVETSDRFQPPGQTHTTPPWRLPLLIGILILGGTVVAWRSIRRNKS